MGLLTAHKEETIRNLEVKGAREHDPIHLLCAEEPYLCNFSQIHKVGKR